MAQKKDAIDPDVDELSDNDLLQEAARLGVAVETESMPAADMPQKEIISGYSAGDAKSATMGPVRPWDLGADIRQVLSDMSLGISEPAISYGKAAIETAPEGFEGFKEAALKDIAERRLQKAAMPGRALKSSLVGGAITLPLSAPAKMAQVGAKGVGLAAKMGAKYLPSLQGLAQSGAAQKAIGAGLGAAGSELAERGVLGASGFEQPVDIETALMRAGLAGAGAAAMGALPMTDIERRRKAIDELYYEALSPTKAQAKKVKARAIGEEFPLAEAGQTVREKGLLPIVGSAKAPTQKIEKRLDVLSEGLDTVTKYQGQVKGVKPISQKQYVAKIKSEVRKDLRANSKINDNEIPSLLSEIERMMPLKKGKKDMTPKDMWEFQKVLSKNISDQARVPGSRMSGDAGNIAKKAAERHQLKALNDSLDNMQKKMTPEQRKHFEGLLESHGVSGVEQYKKEMASLLKIKPAVEDYASRADILKPGLTSTLLGLGAGAGAASQDRSGAEIAAAGILAHALQKRLPAIRAKTMSVGFDIATPFIKASKQLEKIKLYNPAMYGRIVERAVSLAIKDEDVEALEDIE